MKSAYSASWSMTFKEARPAGQTIREGPLIPDGSIPDKRSFMLDFSATHWCILANFSTEVDLS